MNNQGASLNERLPTTRDIAGERTLIRMKSVVPLQLKLVIEALHPKCQASRELDEEEVHEPCGSFANHTGMGGPQARSRQVQVP